MFRDGPRVKVWDQIRQRHLPAFNRLLTHTLAGRGRIEYLWKEQQGRCVVCGQALCIEEQPWHIHHRVWRSQGGQETCDNLEMLHANCHRQIHSKKESLKDQAASCKGR
jgi:RNA-directed DNA polymerase